MKFDNFSCDAEGCKVTKGSNNHWFKFTPHPTEFIVTDWSGDDHPATQHLCSDSCVIRTVQKWLSEQKEISQKGE